MELISDQSWSVEPLVPLQSISLGSATLVTRLCCQEADILAVSAPSSSCHQGGGGLAMLFTTTVLDTVQCYSKQQQVATPKLAARSAQL